MNHPLKILYLSYDGMTDPLGQSQVLPYLIGLTKEGYSFTLISFEKKERFEQQKETISAICKRNNIDWHPQFYTKKPPVISTMRDVSKMKKVSLKLHQIKQFDLIHCRSYIAAMIGLHFKRKRNVPFIFDMRGFWADERVDGGLWNLKNPIFKTVYTYFKKKEIQFLKESMATVSLTNAGKLEMEKWEVLYKEQFSPIRVIPCCTDLEVFSKVERSNEYTNLGYIGSLGTWYLLDEMLAFFKVYKALHNTAKFHFLTKDDPQLILKKGLALGLQANDFIIEEATRDEIKDKVKTWKYAVFFIKPSYSKISSSPVKQGELMAMGIPVFCNAGVGDSDQIIHNYHSGILVKELNEINYQIAIEQMETTKFDTDTIRAGAEAYFSLNNGIQLYKTIYDTI